MYWEHSISQIFKWKQKGIRWGIMFIACYLRCQKRKGLLLHTHTSSNRIHQKWIIVLIVGEDNLGGQIEYGDLLVLIVFVRPLVLIGLFINPVCITYWITNTKPADEQSLLGNRLILFPFKIILMCCFLKTSYTLLFIHSFSRFYFWQIILYKMYNVMFWYMYLGKMITTIKLIIIPTPSYNYHLCVCEMRALEFCNLSKFQVYIIDYSHHAIH